MKATSPLPWICLFGLLAGCAAYRVAGQVQTGRQALIMNEPERALPYLLEAAETNPNYVYRSMDFHEGVWTYVGRAQYGTGRFKEARDSLERALALDPDDHLARLYLGLTLARTGDDARGFKEIERAMIGIHEWLDYMERTRPIEAYWDPLREIRTAIQQELATLPGKDFNRAQLIANAEWLGRRFEVEVDEVRGAERRDFNRGIGRRRGGLSVGIGVGF